MSSVFFHSPELSLPEEQPLQAGSKEQGCCKTVQTLTGTYKAISLEAVVKDLTEGGCVSPNLLLFLPTPQMANPASLRGHQGRVRYHKVLMIFWSRPHVAVTVSMAGGAFQTRCIYRIHSL